jgi:hypothetical protein
MVTWPHAPGQNIMAAGVCGEEALHLLVDRTGQRRGWDKIQLPRTCLPDLLPPYPLKFQELPEIVPTIQHTAFWCVCGILHIQTITVYNKIRHMLLKDLMNENYLLLSKRNTILYTMYL